jgi:hypothetical protein
MPAPAYRAEAPRPAALPPPEPPPPGSPAGRPGALRFSSLSGFRRR